MSMTKDRMVINSARRQVVLYRSGQRRVLARASMVQLNEIRELLRRSPSWMIRWGRMSNGCGESWERIPEGAQRDAKR